MFVFFNNKVVVTPAPGANGDKPIRTRELSDFELNMEEVQVLPKPKESEAHERWIVVTSIFAPTEDMKLLSKLPGWKMVVVGDKKSPKEYK